MIFISKICIVLYPVGMVLLDGKVICSLKHRITGWLVPDCQGSDFSASVACVVMRWERMSTCPHRQGHTLACEVVVSPGRHLHCLIALHSFRGPASVPGLSRSWPLPCLNLLPGQGPLHSVLLPFTCWSLSEIRDKELSVNRSPVKSCR